MNWVIGLIESIRSARAEMHVPAGLKVDMLHLGLDEAAAGAWTRSEALIMKLARVQSLTHVTDLPKGCITLAVEGGTFALPLADIIDVGEEKSRLEKVLEKLGKELGGIKGRLNNPKFVASAPDEVVEENRERLAQGEDEATKIKAALARLAEIG
jgi:valyl-tRNA synthetase